MNLVYLYSLNVTHFLFLLTTCLHYSNIFYVFPSWHKETVMWKHSLLLEIHRLYSKNSLWVKSVLTPAAARTPSAAAIINWAGVITDASPAAYTP
jgi:hypothetical protein